MFRYLSRSRTRSASSLSLWFWITVAFIAGRPLGAQEKTDSVVRDTAKVEVRVNGKATDQLTLKEAVRLDTAEVVVKSGDKVKTLLWDRGIVPDASAISLFYQLNPQIPSADQLEVGSTIRIPVLNDLAGTSGAASGRVSMLIEPDTTYKSLLLAQARLIAALTDSIHRLSRSNRSAQLNQAATAIEENTEQLIRARIPLAPETAAALSSQLSAVHAEVVDAAHNTAALDRTTSTVTRQAAQSINAVSAAATAGRNARVEVEIDVVDRVGNPSQNLQIIYVRPMYAPDRHRAESIPKMSTSRVSNVFDVGRYVMWVESLGGDTLSVPQERSIKSTTKEIVISVR